MTEPNAEDIAAANEVEFVFHDMRQIDDLDHSATARNIAVALCAAREAGRREVQAEAEAARLDRDKILFAEGREFGRREGIEAAARVVDGSQEAHHSSAIKDGYYLTPRTHNNNLSGLSYAAGIRALADTPAPERENSK